MKKRVIAFFISVLLLLNSFVIFADDTKDAVPAEESAINTVLDLGLITLDDYSADRTIQRRELAEAVVQSMGAGDKRYPAVFNDVEKNDNKYNYINGAYSLGILNGYFDGGFHPFSTVTYNEAITTMVRMAGYSIYAEYKGGYPAGYIMAARELKITRGINVSGNEPVTLEAFCTMLLKTLEVDMLEGVSVINDEIVYSADSGKSLLSEKLELELVEGAITGNYMTELTGASSLNKNEIKIDNVIFTTALEELPRQLGKQFVFYTEGKNKKNIVAYREEEKNEEIYISSEDIIDVSNGKISYMDKSGKEKYVTLYDGADFIYNGSAKLSWSEKDISLVNGEVRIIDVESDGKADVIFANEYKNLIVKSFVEEDGIIKFNTTEPEWRSICISEDEDVVYELLDSEGNSVLPASLNQWNILSVAKSLDGKAYVMRMGKSYIDGACNSISDDEITIGDEVYNVDTKINTNSVNGNIILGKTGRFYLDYMGRVAAVSYDEMPLKNYAYIVAFDNSNNGLNSEVLIKLFNYDGTFKIYRLSDKIKINGKQSKPEDILKDYKFATLGKAVNQLAVYEKNSKDEITAIYSADDASLYSEAEREMRFTISESFPSVSYRMGNMNMFASRYFVTDNTFIFVVPDDISETENFKVVKRKNLIGDRSYYKVKLYDIDANHKISAAVMQYKTDFFEQNVALIGAVLKNVKAIDEEGNEITRITMRSGSTNTVLNANENIDVKIEWNAIVDLSKESPSFIDRTQDGNKYIKPEKLKVGDIIQYVNDPNGKLSALYLLYRNGTESIREVMGSGQASKDNAYATKYYTYTKIKKILDKAILVEVPSQDETELYDRAFPFLDGTLFLKYNPETQKVEEYSVERLQEGDSIFLYAQATNVKLVVVYERE